MNNYALNKFETDQKEVGIFETIKKLSPLVKSEKRYLTFAAGAILASSTLSLFAPYLIGYTVDVYVRTRNFDGVLFLSSVLFAVYVAAFIAGYFQTTFTGTVGQNVLFHLRNALFEKIQSLPIAFFNTNSAGDLISRINNDTDKLNQFFSQSLVQFMANVIAILGTGIFMLLQNWRLGLAALVPALFLFFFTKAFSLWMKRANAKSLKSTGGMSAEISEALDNFKAVIAFNRRDFFQKKFDAANEENYKNAIKAGIANNVLTPMYGLFSGTAQMIVLLYGFFLISSGLCTLGILISFLIYVSRFYDPLRQIASLWGNFQIALAGSDRIHDILALESDLKIVPSNVVRMDGILEFQNVHFQYPDGKEVLHNVNFHLEKGKTYALVGPTGGGKTTTASLMARLYDPTDGAILFHGRDIRSYEISERAQRIGFILQEPFLFSGTVRENILYGNTKFPSDCLEAELEKAGLETLLLRFTKGLETNIIVGSNDLSLGQRQLIAFIRAMLRNPELLILDEATANVDTITEGFLEEILKKLPKETTKVIIAHRLNTIENADQIFFVNAGEITLAGSMEHAVQMLLHGKRDS